MQNKQEGSGYILDSNEQTIQKALELEKLKTIEQMDDSLDYQYSHSKKGECEQIIDFSQQMIQNALKNLKSIDNFEDNQQNQSDINDEDQLDKLTDLAKRIIQNQTDKLNMEIQKTENFKLLKSKLFNPQDKKMKKFKSTQEEFKITKKLYEDSFQRKKQKEINEVKRQQALEPVQYSPQKNKFSENIIKNKQDQGEYQPLQQRYPKILKEKKDKLNLLTIQNIIESTPIQKQRSKTPNFKITIDRLNEWQTRKKSKIIDQIAAKRVNELLSQSFQPSINDKSRNIFKSNVRKHLTKPDVLHRLQDQEKKKQLHINELRKQTLPSFQPTININSANMINKKKRINISTLCKDQNVEEILENEIQSIQKNKIKGSSPPRLSRSQSPPSFESPPKVSPQSTIKKSMSPAKQQPDRSTTKKMLSMKTKQLNKYFI